jgi:HSP20 family protein
MSTLTRRRWGTDVTPWKELEAFGNRIGRWFDSPSLFEPLRPTMFSTSLLSEAGTWMPAVELVESDTEFVLTAEVPGMSKADLDISIDDNVLTLKGEKKLEREENRERMHIRERAYGSFERCFALPPNIEADKIKAEYHDGVLEVHIPKGPQSKGRHIEIK